MKVIELLQKIENKKLEELPLEIRYKGNLYSRKDASYTYYKKGCMKCNTLKIDTFDLDENVDIVDIVNDKHEDEEDKEDVYDLCDKIRDILDDIENLDLEEF